MSESTMPDHAAQSTAGRHRGPASADEAERADKAHQPHGKHRRPSED
ncbi:hypothetical protein [Actinacidiphila sp. ITFR-21]|nr:hypothetical protein [Streptomyces sp. ITFR-21]WNI15311.1 hypothetical protein RLT57_07045 [Streptomyces sp. ITFR-21]